ncbi:DNA translocase FtsK [Candidatus Roizmanbacteria bacterium CG_4_10_14_0_8_um_filter_39_9]|uniref:DNA translocase FtsK n=1 Tax=Candidatus Roizmanbacteria bacterium CG_4_10_14_0_8_um_filter_39_9 TaxID=1974829 RepID=A0A2M7QEN9_9BACT|nr:MAG: DNA translocase FtsK [Candidatus Roizmanbacteria bacterium CG_4_10_14_0_8_um_filter_39_9]
MARKKSLFKIPFLKIKVNSKTVFNIVGFLLIGFALILLFSFANMFAPQNGEGVLLRRINQYLLDLFGAMALSIPFIIILIAGHLFNSKKFNFVKLNITFGLIFISVSLLGLFQAGSIGKRMFTLLDYYISLPGAIIVLFIVFIIGLILFLDTSIDVFFFSLFGILKTVGSVFKKVIMSGKPSKNVRLKQDKFIEDNKVSEKPKAAPQPIPTPAIHPIAPVSSVNSAGQPGFVVRPISQASSTWIFPPLNLLADVKQIEADRGDVNANAAIIENTLESFGIRARVSEVNKGPAVTQYAIQITQGTKLSKITSLSNDLALALAASTGQVRIEAPIPGRALVGVEIPNNRPQIVTLKSILADPIFTKSNDPLLVPLGLDVSGKPQAVSISKMPHCLIAGTTGSGKSVMLNAWISTFLFRTRPEELRLILVDPKRVEMTSYNGISHLLTEVIVDTEKTVSALRWTVAEMETRYKQFAKAGARNIESYNLLEGVEKKPYIVFVIDELADLMIFAPGDVEALITRIAQMARATGIHLVLATQRPSVDVITGLMKANIPTRLAFNVSSMIDSRVIIDMPGAEKLLGKGDMLFLPPDQAKPRRIQGPFITEKETSQLVKFIRSQAPEVHYTEEITEGAGEMLIGGQMPIPGVKVSDRDPLFNQAVQIISSFDKASASLLQRRLKVGYARAARLLDELEGAGMVSPAEGSKPREVIKRPMQQDTTPIVEEVI